MKNINTMLKPTEKMIVHAIPAPSGFNRLSNRNPGKNSMNGTATIGLTKDATRPYGSSNDNATIITSKLRMQISKDRFFLIEL